MKTCPNCRAQLDGDAVFCTGCGQKLEGGAAAQPPNVCRNCGNPLTEDTQFCTKCGTPVGNSPTAPQQNVAPPASPQSAPTPTYTPPTSIPPGGTGGTAQNLTKNPAVLIGGVLALVAIVAFLFFNSSGSGNIPKTPEDFVSAYNREIKDIAKEKKVNVDLIALEDVPSELNALRSTNLQSARRTFLSFKWKRFGTGSILS